MTLTRRKTPFGAADFAYTATLCTTWPLLSHRKKASVYLNSFPSVQDAEVNSLGSIFSLTPCPQPLQRLVTSRCWSLPACSGSWSTNWRQQGAALSPTYSLVSFTVWSTGPAIEQGVLYCVDLRLLSNPVSCSAHWVRADTAHFCTIPSCMVDRDTHMVGSVYDCVIKSEHLNPACRPSLETENVSRCFPSELIRLLLALFIFLQKIDRSWQILCPLPYLCMNFQWYSHYCVPKLGCINNMYVIYYYFFQ